MDLAGYVINAVLVEGRSVTEVCEAHDVSRSWLYELIARYRELGDAGLRPQSRRPRSSPTRVDAAVEDEIVALRKELTDLGVDAGAHTIHYHLERRYRRCRRSVPSVATIWRVLCRRGFVTRQPQKRPKSSWRRFQAELPNECWQADTTHWTLADGRDVEILNIIDDHSRLLVASRVFVTAKAADVVETFHQGAAELGLPASMLTDNGAIFTAESRNGACAIELELLALGIDYKHSRPYHPQTCGKVERFHQTLKKWLAKQRPAKTVAGLQAQLDRVPPATTTRSDPTEPSTGAPPPTRSPRAPKPRPAAEASPCPPNTESAATASTQTGKVTLRYRSEAPATSASDAATPAPAS